MPFSVLGEATPYKDIVKSKPVLINGFEFVAVTEAQWRVIGNQRGSIPVDVQLWITNRTEKDLIFRVFDTFGVVIKDGWGKEMPGDGRRDGTRLTRPVLIRAGETYCLSRDASFSWHEDGGRDFGYEDGTGAVFVWGPIYSNLGKRIVTGQLRESLAAGKYSLSFRVASKGEDEGMKVDVKHHGLSAFVPPCWEGKGSTAEVPFEVVDPPPEL